MSGYCPNCGNTLCVCDDSAPPLSTPSQQRRDNWSCETVRALRRKVRNLKEQVAIRDISIDRWRKSAWFHLSEARRQRRARQQDLGRLQADNLTMAQQVRDLVNERDALKASQWEPAEGIWLVSRNEYGRSSTLVASPGVSEQEAIVRSILQQHYDVAVRAIMGAYERDKFCPVMLEHESHEGYCGVWPSAHAIWSAVRDALAQKVSKDG